MKRILSLLCFIISSIIFSASFAQSSLQGGFFDELLEEESRQSQDDTPSIFPKDENSNSQDLKSSYRISPHDTLEISVYNEPDLDITVTVSAQGTIIYPLIGEIKIGGLTAKEATEKIEALLKKDYLVNPNVNIFIREYSKFFILGAVHREGDYELKGRFTLLDALALAGGAKENANLSKIKVIRKEGQTSKELIVDLNNQGKFFFIEPSDRIIVEEYGKISVLGEVHRPGNFYFREGLTLLDALALAGGAKENANLSKIKVIRKEGQTSKELIIDLEKERPEVFLQEKDTVFVESQGKISVLGEVRKPGSYYYRKGLTVIEAIAMAGGFTDIASKNKVEVMRQENGEEKIIKVPVDYILKTGDKSKDILLKENDIVRVPESLF